MSAHPFRRRELTAYGMCLTSMSRLESRHHLMANQLASGRASLPPLIASELRRHANTDFDAPSFRSRLSHYLDNLGSVLGDDAVWNTRSEFLKIVYGYGIDVMHINVSKQVSALAEFKHHAALTSAADMIVPMDAMGSEAGLCVEHAKAILEPGNFYAHTLPLQPGKMHVFQLLNSNPGAKRYVQTICFIGEDAGTLVITTRKRVAVRNTNETYFGCLHLH